MVFDTCPMEGMDSARVKTPFGIAASGGGDHGDFCGQAGPREGFYGAQQRFDRKHFYPPPLMGCRVLSLGDSGAVFGRCIDDQSRFGHKGGFSC